MVEVSTQAFGVEWSRRWDPPEFPVENASGNGDETGPGVSVVIPEAEVQAPNGAHTCESPDATIEEQSPDAEQRLLGELECELFGPENDRSLSEDEASSESSTTPGPHGRSISPEYEVKRVNPNDVVVPHEDEEDSVLLSAVARSLDSIGIVIPPMVRRREDGNLEVLLGQGRTRVLWARDRKITAIPVVEVKLDALPAWFVMREVAIEDVRRTTGYERLIEWYSHFKPLIDKVHKSQKARRQLLANAQRSRSMLARKTGQPTDKNKRRGSMSETWEGRQADDAVEGHKGREAAFAGSTRFKYPLTVSLFFREAISESTARRMITFLKARHSSDPAIRNLDIPKRLAGIAEGEYSPSGTEKKIHDLERVRLLKRKLREHMGLNEADVATVKRWIFERIRHTNLWTWSGVNQAFGILKSLAHAYDYVRQEHDLSKEEAKVYVCGEYPGADVPLNLLTYLTRPGDLVVDFFAGSGATGDAARHFLDPRWQTESGEWVWWRHWRELLPQDEAGAGKQSLALNRDVFPRGYWETDHRRKCLQFDLEPNALALKEFGDDFILQHDVVDGVTDWIEGLVRGVAPQGASLVYLDPPYLSQADYRSSTVDSGKKERDQESGSQIAKGKVHTSRSDALATARSKVRRTASERNLCRLGLSEYVRTMARFILQCERILTPAGHIALFMGTDSWNGYVFDPVLAIFEEIQRRYDRIQDVPYELDRTGPLYERVIVPNHSYGLAAHIADRQRRGHVGNVLRYVWILRRREKGSNEPLV